MPADYFSKRQIHFVCFHFNMDGKDYPDDLGKTMSFEEFYSRIKAGAMPTTSQVSVGQFLEFFNPFLAAGKDILHISLSSGLSGSFNSAIAAREELLVKYPDRKIILVDSLSASSGYGLLIDLVANLRDQGAALEEIQAWLEANKLNLHHWFFTSDLSHLKRGGRLSPTSAYMGTLLNICPLLNMNNAGKLVPRLKVRGKSKVMQEMVNKMKDHARDGLNYDGKCFISHSACFEDARKVADLVEAAFPNLKGPVLINSIGSVIGAHTGPGTVAIFFEGDPRKE
jgi:DegV family protein with EDD domain